jgi:hypothetical protein
MRLVFICMGLSPFEGAKFKVTNKEYCRSLFWTWIIRHIVPWTYTARDLWHLYICVCRRTRRGGGSSRNKSPLTMLIGRFIQTRLHKITLGSPMMSSESNHLQIVVL